MSDPGEALQRAIYAQLCADADVSTFVAGRVFDLPPQGGVPVFPYIAFGAFQVLDDGAGCIDGAEVFVTLDVWSRAQGTVEAKRIGGAVKAALHEADLDLGSAHRLIEIMHRSTTVFLDPDGLTAHGVLTFRALTEAAI